MEKWKKVEGFDNYEVSDHGRVRSLTHYYRRKHRVDGSECFIPYQGKTLKTTPINNPKTGKPLFARVTLRKNGKIFQKRVHCLVLESFCGLCPQGMKGCHNDGNPLNNNLVNLRWDSPLSKISETDVIEIFKQVHNGIHHSILADKFNVSVSAILAIKYKRNWKRVVCGKS